MEIARLFTFFLSLAYFFCRASSSSVSEFGNTTMVKNATIQTNVLTAGNKFGCSNTRKALRMFYHVHSCQPWEANTISKHLPRDYTSSLLLHLNHIKCNYQPTTITKIKDAWSLEINLNKSYLLISKPFTQQPRTVASHQKTPTRVYDVEAAGCVHVFFCDNNENIQQRKK